MVTDKMSLKCEENAVPGLPESDYLILIRNTGWQNDLSAEEIEKVLGKFGAWVERLRNDGKIKLAFPLAREGKFFTNKNVIVDGPFTESKEAIAGFILFQADSLADAVKFAGEAPCLEFGQTIELRAVLPEPPELRQLRP